MHVIVVASQKGGSGKTTLTRSLAVLAQNQAGATALLDTDPQGSLTSWWNRRAVQEPVLIRSAVDELDDAIGQLEAAGIEYLFIDTAPSVHPELRQLIARASLVVVPVRPSPDDLDAVGDTLGLIYEANKPFHFVLNQAKPKTRLQAQAILQLAQHGKLAPTVVHAREDFPTMAIAGQTPSEADGQGPSSIELQDVFQYMLTQLRTAAPAHVAAD